MLFWKSKAACWSTEKAAYCSGVVFWAKMSKFGQFYHTWTLCMHINRCKGSFSLARYSSLLTSSKPGAGGGACSASISFLTWRIKLSFSAADNVFCSTLSLKASGKVDWNTFGCFRESSWNFLEIWYVAHKTASNCSKTRFPFAIWAKEQKYL